MSLMGKTLEYSYPFPDHVGNIPTPRDITVSDAVELDFHTVWGVAYDVTDHQITATFNIASAWSSRGGREVIFEDKYDVLNDIVGVTFDTNILNMNDFRISFTENSVTTLWLDNPYDQNSYLTLTLQFAINHVDGTEKGNHLVGRADEDLIIGKAGNDLLEGLEDNDRLYGGAGADTLRGGQGDDVLRSKHGNDQFAGDDGADIFVYSSKSGRDTIMDFDTGIDKIDITGWDAIGGFASLKRHASNHSGVLWITEGKDTLIIKDFSKGELDAGDFLF